MCHLLERAATGGTLAARGEEGLEQGGGGVGKKTRGDVHLVIELGVGEKFKAGAERAALRVVGAIDEARDAGLNEGAGTHGARFESDEKGGVGEAIVAEKTSSFA